MNINTRTVFKNIVTDNSTIEVKAPSFRFVNAGNVTVFINNLPLMPGASLGDDSSIFWASLLATNPKATMERTDTFAVAFKAGLGISPDLNNGDEGFAEVPVQNRRRSVFLIETFYSLQK